MTEPLEQNKQNVIAFYDLMFNQCQPAEAIERCVAGIAALAGRTTHDPSTPD